LRIIKLPTHYWWLCTGYFLRFDLADRKHISRDHNYFSWIPR